MQGGFGEGAGLLAARDGVEDKGGEVFRDVVVGGSPGGMGVDAVGVFQGDGVDGQLVEGRVGVGGHDIEPVDLAGIDFGIELLAQVGGEGLDHVGGTDAAVGHVDESELDAFAGGGGMPPMGDLAKAGEVGIAFVFDDGRIFDGQLAGSNGGIEDGAGDTRFMGGEGGVIGGALGGVAVLLIAGSQENAGVVAHQAGAELALLRPGFDLAVTGILQMFFQVLGLLRRQLDMRVVGA